MANYSRTLVTLAVLGTSAHSPDADVFSNGTGLTATQIGYGSSGNKIAGSAGFVTANTSSTATQPLSGVNIGACATDAVASLITQASFGGGANLTTGLIGYPCQGTGAIPTATISGDQYIFQLRGRDDVGVVGVASASIALVADTTWTSTNRQSHIEFRTNAAATTSTVAGRIDSNQTLVMGGNFNSVGTFSAGVFRPHIQTCGTAAANAGIAQTFWAANTNGPTGLFAKSRSGTVGTQGVITTGDTLGTMSWQGDDGTNFINAADIICVAEGTLGTGQIPGRMRVRTATSAGTITQALAIDSNQVVLIGSTTVASSALYTGGTINPAFQNTGNGRMATACYAANATGSSMYLAKSRGTALGTMTLLNANDVIGTLDFQGADGINFVSGAQIVATATGTPASTRMGSSLLLKTATDAAPSVMTTAITIDNAQQVTHNATTDSTSISTGGAVFLGGLGVAKRITIDGATGKTIRVTNINANAAVAVTLGSTGCTGTTAGAPQGWMRIDIAGTDRFIPFW